jgi:hypothetical protein
MIESEQKRGRLLTIHPWQKQTETDDFPALASSVARCTHVIQSAKGRRQGVSLRKRALTGRVKRPVNIKHDPGASGSSHQSPSLFLVGIVSKRTAEQVIEKERAQRFDGGLGQDCQKARERRAGWEPITAKQGHERNSKRLESLIKGLQGAFTRECFLVSLLRRHIFQLICSLLQPRCAIRGKMAQLFNIPHPLSARVRKSRVMRQRILPCPREKFTT